MCTSLLNHSTALVSFHLSNTLNGVSEKVLAASSITIVPLFLVQHLIDKLECQTYAMYVCMYVHTYVHAFSEVITNNETSDIA